jgi:hypothetical protein
MDLSTESKREDKLSGNFEIHAPQVGEYAKVFFDGQEITSLISSIELRVAVGEVTSLWIACYPENVKIFLDDPKVEFQPLFGSLKEAMERCPSELGRSVKEKPESSGRSWRSLLEKLSDRVLRRKRHPSLLRTETDR